MNRETYSTTGLKKRHRYIRPALRAKVASSPLCYYCGGPFEASGQLARTLDHKLPVYMGGEDILENIVAAHRYCNGARGPLDRSEFREWVRDGGTKKTPVVVRECASMLHLPNLFEAVV